MSVAKDGCFAQQWPGTSGSFMTRAKTLLRASRGPKRDYGTLRAHLEPGRFAASHSAGLDSPVFVFLQSNRDDQASAIGTCISDEVDWRGTSSLFEFLMRENAEFLFGRLKVEADAPVVEHHLFGSTPARQILIVAICIASIAVEFTTQLKRFGALMVAKEGAA